MRFLVRHLTLLVTVVWLSVCVAAAVAVADETDPTSKAPIPVAATDQISNAETEQTLAPQLTDEQAATELPHQDLDRGEALNLMHSVFELQLESPAGVLDHLQVDKFLSDNVAVVASAGELTPPGVEVGGEEGEAYDGPALIEATVPLRTESASGSDEVVDLSLQQVEGELQSTNPLVEVGIPQELGEGIALPAPEVQIELPSAPDERAPSIIGGSVAFYPNVALDTDLAVAPTSTGVETLTQIRSAAAPLSQTFRLDLPANSQLQGTSTGGAEITDGETTLVNILPPSALDASGESVPVDMQVAGDTLTLNLEPEEDVSYPILLDPVYEAYSWYGTGSYKASGQIGSAEKSGKLLFLRKWDSVSPDLRLLFSPARPYCLAIRPLGLTTCPA